MDKEKLGALTQGFADINKRLDKQDSVLKDIHDQNTQMSSDVSNLKFWKAAVIWGAGVIASATLILYPIVTQMISDKISSDVQNTVEQTVIRVVDEQLDDKIKEVLLEYQFDYYPKNNAQK